MKIPYYHIKEEVKRIDKHNANREREIEREHQNDREAVAREMVEIGNSKSFKKDIERNKNNPRGMEKILRKVYGDKVIPYRNS